MPLDDKKHTHSAAARKGARAPRADGDSTRQQIIETAGRLFSENGYQGTTSKQICAQCGCNIAAVNYHFGSRDGLYTELLIQSHRRFISMHTITDISNSGLDSRAKLGQIIDTLIDGIDAQRWHARLLIREMMAPTPFIEGMLNTEALPKFSVIKDLVSDITGLDKDEPAMALHVLSTVAPCMFILIANRAVTRKVLGDFTADRDALKTHIKRFLFAGFDAISQNRP